MPRPQELSPGAEAVSAPVRLMMAAALMLTLSPPGQAESAPERGQMAVKYLDYLDSQPGESRIRVKATALSLLNPVGSQWLFAATGTVDSISGASPYFQTSALTKMKDERRAVDTQVTRYLDSSTVTVGANASTESDYLSRGVSMQITRSDESRNTTWALGLAQNDDVINPTNHIVDHERKHVTGVLLGVTRVLTPRDIVQFNFSRSMGRGYFSDPYKFADLRPRQKDGDIALLRWNHHMESTGSTLRWSYRYYRDNWALRSHTLGLEVAQPLGPGWMLVPSFRAYSQTAAGFYVPPERSAYPFAPQATGPYSEDQRLSAFAALTLGLKLVWRLDEDWVADFKFERYAQRGSWSFLGKGTNGLDPFDARMVQAGLSRAF